MDSSISANYKNIVFSFRIKHWEVSSAVHISSGIDVSIWKFLYNDIISNYTEAEISSFISKYRNSLVASQHIHHFNILRIFEISDENEPLSFSSEKIEKPISQEKNVTNDEAAFIISQLCTALCYLHQELHVAYFAISPDNIFLSPHFNVKLANLVHFAKFTDNDSVVEPNLYPLNASIFDIDPRFASPEVTNHESLSSYSDVFSFALFVIYLFTNEVPKLPISDSKLCISNDLKDIVKQCLLVQPEKRPTFDQILSEQSMNPVAVRFLNFIPKINESSIEVRENFYKKLSDIISDFSPRILTLKFTPILVKEIIDNKELSQQLLPMLLIAAEKINPLDIYKIIVNPLFKTEQYADYLFEKALMITDASVFVPILIETYKSKFKSISSRKKELLKSVNALENIKSIICMIGSIDNESVIESILPVCKGKVEISDSAIFIKQLKQLYKKFNPNITVCTSIANALVSIQPNAEYASKAVSLSFNLIKSLFQRDIKGELVKFIEKFVSLARDSIESTESLSISASQSSGQNLNLIDDDLEVLSSRKGKKDKRHKEKKNRRSSLTTTTMKKMDLTIRNNSFSNSQSLFALPKGINPLSLKNIYDIEIDPFEFRKYINAMELPIVIKDSDPFEILTESRRRMSDFSININSSSDNEEDNYPTNQNDVFKNESVEPKNVIPVQEKKKITRINKSHRRSLSTQDVFNFTELDAQPSNSNLLFSGNNNSLSKVRDQSDDDEDGPFKVSNKGSLLSASIGSGFPTLMKSYSSSNNISNPFNSKSPNYISNNNLKNISSRSMHDLSHNNSKESPQETIQSQSKAKYSKQKRPSIPTPPTKRTKKNNIE